MSLRASLFLITFLSIVGWGLVITAMLSGCRCMGLCR